MKRLVFVVVLAAFVAAACGGHSRRLGDGRWYGKIVAVDVAHRTLTFAPACELESRRWLDVLGRDRVATSVPLSLRPDLEIYYRPGVKAARGHSQPSGLKQLADAASRRHDPDFPPGWFVTVRDRVAVSVREDSGLRSSGAADKRTFSCVWSRRTRAFVGSK